MHSFQSRPRTSSGLSVVMVVSTRGGRGLEGVLCGPGPEDCVAPRILHDRTYSGTDTLFLTQQHSNSTAVKALIFLQ